MSDTISFVTDSHAGADRTGFQQQPRHPDLALRIWQGIAQAARECGAALVLHGGDLPDTGAPAEIALVSAQLAALERPVAAVLGNHDMSRSDALDPWCALACDLPGSVWADSIVRLTSVDVILRLAWNGCLKLSRRIRAAPPSSARPLPRRGLTLNLLHQLVEPERKSDAILEREIPDGVTELLHTLI